MNTETAETTTGSLEREIRDCFTRLGTDLAKFKYRKGLYAKWSAMSQYGFVLQEGFETREEAERYVIERYSQRMNLIRW